MISSEVQGPAQGQYVDIRQKENGPWQVGLIISRVKGILKIRFDGWSSKFDQLLHINSSRLKSFRSFVRGYTGQQKNPAVRDHIKYSNELHQEKKQKLVDFLESLEIEAKSEHEITQYLRGQHYFYIDFLLTINYSSEHSLKSVYQYLQRHLTLAKDMIDAINEAGISKWCSQQSQKHSKAYRESYYEIFDAVYIIAVMNLRQLNFQKLNEKVIKELYGENATHDQEISKRILSTKLEESYLKMLDVLEKQTEEGKSVDIAFLFVVYQMYGPIEKAFNFRSENVQANKEEKKKIVLRLLTIIKSQFELLTSAALKPPQNQHLLESLLNLIKTIYFRYGLQNLAYQWIQKSKLRVFFLLLQSQTLEKKLKGISKTKDFYQDIITVNEFQIYKLSKNEFKSYLKQQQIVYSIFFNNQHPEILKKGSELCLLLLRDDFVQLQELLAVWNQCSHKHEAIRKVIYQLWIDIVPYVSSEQLQKFTAPIIVSSKQSKQNQESVLLFIEEWQIQILITFMTNLVKRYEQIMSQRDEIDKILMKLLNIGYQKLVNMEKSNSIKHFVGEYAKIIHHSLLLNDVMRESYRQITRQEHVNVNILLLISIYQESVEKQTFIPANALQVIFFILESSKNRYLSSTIFQFMDEILNFSNNIKDMVIFKKEQLDDLWRLGQKHEDIKVQFYGWLLKHNSEGVFGKIIYQINGNITPELRVQIFNNYLCDFNKMDYINLNLQQLQIFKEFLIYQNERQKKIQVKKLMSLCKIIRIRENEILGNKFMWDIFLNCKHQQVIKELSKLILSFHMNFHENIDFKTKKVKILSLLNRVEKHIKDGFKKGNLKLMKHSLIILKDLIDFVKEKKPIDYEPLQTNNQPFFKTIIKVQYENKKFDIQTFYGTTFYEIKSKISEIIKQERTKFQMINSKNEEICLEYSSIPLFLMQEKSIKVVLVDQNQETIPSVVLNFIKDKIQNTLIEMLQDQTICESVYNVLQDIQIKAEQGEQLQYKLNLLIQKYYKLKKDEVFGKYESYICLFYLKVLQCLIEKPKFLIKCLENKSLANLILRLDTSLSNPLLIVYTYSLLQLIQKIFKLSSKPDIQKALKAFTSQFGQILRQKCVSIIDNLCVFIQQNMKDDSNKSKKIRTIFHSLYIIQFLSDNFLEYFIKHVQFKAICENIYLKNNMNEIRLIFSEKIKKFIKNSKKQQMTMDIEQILIEVFIKDLYPKIREQEGVYSSENKVGHFYKFISFIVVQSSFTTFQELLDVENINFYNKVLTNVKSFQDSPNPIDPVNYILSSHLDIISSFYKRRPQLLSDQETIDYFMYDCLFYKAEVTKRADVCCKKVQSIKAAIQVIQAGLIEVQNKEKFFKILRSMTEMHQNQYWRTNDNWNISVQSQVKAKYVGLQNPGCICYCNSLLQQLFMTKNFRNSFKKIKLNRDQSQNSKIQMLKALKDLFFNLEYSEQIALNPVSFIKSIKTNDNKPMIKIFVQMDIDQFCSILFDRIQQQINIIPKESNFVKDIFGGIYAHQIISKECNHCSQRQQQFISIGLQVKKHILQSFGALVKGETLDGQNKYYCEKCDKKVKAEKMLTIKTFPKNLILSIKRFQYNYQIDAKIKINDYCEFPTELDLKKFSQQEINKINNPEKNKVNDEGQNEQELPDSYFQYKLKGVVVHAGSADSGHYYSFIEDKDKNWFQFNDRSVSPFDVNNLAEEAFGCKESYQDKTKNAYLLFYEKIQESTVQIEAKQEQEMRSEENSSIVNSISTKNKIINKFRLLFSKDYSEFINYLTQNTKFLGEMSHEEQKSWHEFVISYFLLIKIREENMPDIIKFSKKIDLYIDKNKQFSELLFESLSNYHFLEEIFVYCSNRDKTKIISHFLTKTFLNAYKSIDISQSIKENPIVTKIFSHLFFLGVLHGNIYELQIFIRKVLTQNKMNNDNRLLTFMVNDMNIIKLVTINVFTLPFSRQKEIAVNYKEDQKLNHINSLIKLAKNDGKKSIPSHTKESWHIIELLCECASQEASLKEQEEIEQDQFINVLDVLTQNIQKGLKNSSLHRIIYEAMTQKSVFRLYKTCKIIGRIKELLQAIEKGLKDYESSKYRPYLILLSFIYADKDTSEEIIAQSIDMLVKVHAINEKYFIEVNFIHQWIIKYANMNALFVQHLGQNQRFLVQIINWIAERPSPSPEVLKKHKNLANERLMQRLQGILVSSETKEYQEKSKSLRIKFNKILKKTFEKSTSDINYNYLQVDDYPVGSSIMFYDMNAERWTPVKIVQNNFGLLKFEWLQRNKVVSLQLWSDNERISTKDEVQIEKEEEEEQIQQEEGFQSFGQENVEEEDLYN